jgi:hypothetical protein
VRTQAGVDEDAQLARVHHEPVDRELELALRVEEVRLEPAPVRRDRFGPGFREEAFERQWDQDLGNPRDLHLADLPGQLRHAPSALDPS